MNSDFSCKSFGLCVNIYIIQTLFGIGLPFDMMKDVGLKFYFVPSPYKTVT